MNKKLHIVLVFVAVVAIIEGFRLVTQSGLTGWAGSVQNDGYAVSGGVLILLGGAGLGYPIPGVKRK